MSPVAERVVAEAMAWMDTPYQHQASVRGVGCDCLGLVRGVWRALYGREPQVVEPYRPDWAESGGGETLLEGARRWLVEKPRDAMEPGDVLLFRMAPGACVKHCAIMSRAGDRPRMVHAYWGRAVTESWLSGWWSSRLAGVFAFPDEEQTWRR